MASVSADGLVIGIAEGSCLVYVKTDDGGHEASCSVTVVPGGSEAPEEAGPPPDSAPDEPEPSPTPGEDWIAAAFTP